MMLVAWFALPWQARAGEEAIRLTADTPWVVQPDVHLSMNATLNAYSQSVSALGEEERILIRSVGRYLG